MMNNIVENIMLTLLIFKSIHVVCTSMGLYKCTASFVL